MKIYKKWVLIRNSISSSCVHRIISNIFLIKYMCVSLANHYLILQLMSENVFQKEAVSTLFELLKYAKCSSGRFRSVNNFILFIIAEYVAGDSRSF